jgi:hypothetical protein
MEKVRENARRAADRRGSSVVAAIGSCRTWEVVLRATSHFTSLPAGSLDT